MEEQLMTVERWNDLTVRANFCSRFVDLFTLVDRTQRDDIADIRKPEQENQPPC
jgi:hypothetical protein